MRLLTYTDATEIGGAEIVLGHLLEGLDGSIDVTVLGVEPAVVEQLATRRPGADPVVTGAVGGKADVVAIAAHVAALRRARPDVVHVNLQSPWAGQYAILAAILARRPAIAVEHSVFPSTSALQRLLRRRLDRRLAAHVAVGERSARSIEALAGLEPGSITVIYNGVPDVAAEPVARDHRGPLIGAAGRFSPEKGFDVLIGALSELPADVACVLVGDGPERPRLEALAGDLGVGDRLHVTGWVERARDHLAGLDVVAIPSRFEGFSLVMIESMLARRPIVASAVESIPEAIEDRVTGRLVPAGDSAALAAAIGELLGDPDERRRLGEAARRRALERFTLERMIDSFERLYRRVARG